MKRKQKLELLSPYTKTEEGFLTLNPIPSLITYPIGAFAGYYASKPFTNDEIISLATAGIVSISLTFLTYLTGAVYQFSKSIFQAVKEVKEEIKKENHQKEQVSLESLAFSEPFSKRFSPIVKRAEDYETYSKVKKDR